jgi:hypothetical protein
VAPRDPAALAGAITRVLQDYARYAGGARAAAERTRARYSIASMIDAHERLYERLAERVPPKRSRIESTADGAARLALWARGTN